MNVTGRLLAHSSVLLTPILYAQGMYTRAKISKLPEASGPRNGVVQGSPTLLRLLVLGDSTAAGVGVDSHDEGLAGQTARSLTAMTGATINWSVLASNGITAAGLRAVLNELPDDVRADVIVLGLGANDVFRLQGPVKWERDLRALIDAIRERCGFAPVMVSEMPPIGHFPGLPQPLRSVLGLRARLLDKSTERLAEKMASVHFVSLPIEPDLAMFCSDGIHPSAACYGLWGRMIADAALEHLPQRG